MSDEKKPYSILFIEDEKAIRENYTRYLKRHFENVYEAEDGEEAYKIYKDKKPEILIIDINIPKLNGIELLKKIREHDHTTKAIMLTAHSETHYLLQATELQLTKYLIKPISRDELKGSLDLVIQQLSKFKTSAKNKLILKDNYSWDFTLNELHKSNNTISLTNKERKVLALLFSNLNSTLTYDDIIIHVWYSYDDDKLDALKTIIKNLRRKLALDTIKNVYGRGYKIDNL